MAPHNPAGHDPPLPVRAVLARVAPGRRTWNTTCEDYSQTTRCRTDVWASVVIRQGDDYVVKQGRAFNNPTYLPYMSREQWKSNPLGYTNRSTAHSAVSG